MSAQVPFGWAFTAPFAKKFTDPASAPSTPAFSPASLFAGGEQGGWYDPSDLSTLFQDAAGTVPVVADGDPVGRINDKSGNGFRLAQGTAAARPAYRTAAGLHWLQGDGVDDFLVSASNIVTVKTGWFWACTAEIITGGGINTSLFSGSLGLGAVSTTSDANGIYQRSDVVQRIVASLRIGSGTARTIDLNSAFSIGTGTPFYAEARHESGLLYSSNGVSQASVACVDATTSPVGLISVLSDGPVAKFFGGVCISRPLTADEKTDVQAYLRTKAGI